MNNHNLEKCAEYENKRLEFEEKKRRILEIKVDLDNLDSEKNNNLDASNQKKNSELNSINDRKVGLVEQLESIEKYGDESPELKNYIENQLKKIDSCKEKIDELILERKSEDERANHEHKESITAIESDIETSKFLAKMNWYHLDSEICDIGTNTNIEAFSELMVSEKNEKIKEYTEVLDKEIDEKQGVINSYDNKQKAVLQYELSKFENDNALVSNEQNINVQLEGNLLPEEVKKVLANPVSEVVQSQGINNTETLIGIAKKYNPPSIGTYSSVEVNSCVPNGWEKFVDIGIPTIVAVIVFLFFVISQLELGFVEIASNAVANFLIWIFGGVILGALGFFIAKLTINKEKLGALIGGIIGIFIATRFHVSLAYGFINAIELIVKILICLLIGIGIYILNTKTHLNLAIINLGVKAGIGKKKVEQIKLANAVARKKAIEQYQASLRQYAINNAYCYYVILKYREIIEYITSNAASKELDELKDNLEMLANEKERKIDKFTKNLDELYKEIYDGIEKLEQENKEYVSKQGELEETYNKMISEAEGHVEELTTELNSGKTAIVEAIQKELDACEQEKTEVIDKYNQESVSIENDFIKKSEDLRNEDESLRNELPNDYAILKNLISEIEDGIVEGIRLVDSEGVLADKFYYIDHDKLDKMKESTCESCDIEQFSPVVFYEINHEKKPLVFLYEIEDSDKIGTELCEFMKNVSLSFITTECRDIFNMYISDPVTRAITLQFLEERGVLKVENDIRDLGKKIGESMEKLARKSQNYSIDDYNRNLVKDGYDEGDIGQFGIYNIVQFIVPEEESNQTTDYFNNEIWTRFENGKEFGFLPIIYVNKNDWERTINEEERFRSNLSNKLNYVLNNDTKNVYCIDKKDGHIKTYN